MRGFLSFTLALLLVLIFLSLLSAQKAAIASHDKAEEEALLLEKKYYADLELKQAFQQVFEQSGGSDELQSAQNIAANLEKLEFFAEKHFAEKGIIAEIWFGSPLEGEQAILDQALSQRRPLRCIHCYEFSARTLDWDKKIIYKSTELVFNKRISKQGFVHTPTSEEWVLGNIVFGATFFIPEKNFAWVSIMPEGFGARR